MRSVRQARKLSQKAAAKLLGVCNDTVCNWESGRTSVPVMLMPAVLAFLGYDPTVQPETLSDRMRAYRRRMGLTIKVAAAQLGVNEGSWTDWEKGRIVPREKYVEALEALLG